MYLKILSERLYPRRFFTRIFLLKSIRKSNGIDIKTCHIKCFFSAISSVKKMHRNMAMLYFFASIQLKINSFYLKSILKLNWYDSIL